MSLTTEQYERLCHFLDADMDLAAMESFEKELALNPEMRQQLDFEQSVRDGFGHKKSKSLPFPLETVATQQQMDEAKPKKISIKKWLVIGVAASVLLALGLFALLRPTPAHVPTVAHTPPKDSNTNKKTDQTPLVVTPPKDSTKPADLALLYQKYYKKDSLPKTYPLFLAESFTNYENGDYITIQQLDLSYLPDTRGNDAANSKENILPLAYYYKGISFLETNQTQQAAIHLQWIIKNSTDKLLLAKARWYLALAFIKMNNAEKAIFELKKLRDDKKAKQLFKLL